MNRDNNAELQMDEIEMSEKNSEIKDKKDDIKYEVVSKTPKDNIVDSKKDNPENKINNHFEESNEHERGEQSSDQDIRAYDKFEVPSSLRKTFYCTMALAVCGLTLFILGFIQGVQHADPGKGLTFWILGSIVMIPGGYYSYQFYRAKKTKSLEERDEILDQIPEI